jgi:hypothetical protein
MDKEFEIMIMSCNNSALYSCRIHNYRYDHDDEDNDRQIIQEIRMTMISVPMMLTITTHRYCR